MALEIIAVTWQGWLGSKIVIGFRTGISVGSAEKIRLCTTGFDRIAVSRTNLRRGALATRVRGIMLSLFECWSHSILSYMLELS